MRLATAVVLLMALMIPCAAIAQEEQESGWIDSDSDEGQQQQQGIPARGIGDIEFSLDSVSFLGQEGSTVQEFFLEVPHSQLTFREAEEGFEAVARLELKLKSTRTGATAKDERVVRIHSASLEEAGRDDLAAVIISRFSVEPGLYTYEAKLTDQQARKWQLVHLFRGTRKNGVAMGYVEVKDFGEGLALADPLVAREVRHRVSPSPYSRGDLGIIPNPSHSVGLFQPQFLAYVEVYSPWGEGLQKYKMNYSIVSTADGTIAASQEQEVEVTSDSWAQVASFDMGEVPSGSYLFRAEVVHDSASAVAEVPLQVLWDSASWNKPEADLMQEMSLALTDPELREFKAMSRGEREVFLQRFWNDLDPSPGTAANEAKAEFERRVAYANAHYSETEKGIYTDRGMIYIRYGQPDDIQVQVMPVGDSSLDRVLTGEQDRVLDRDRSAYDEEDFLLRRPGDRRAGDMTTDERAYEIWYYDLRGRELFPSQTEHPKRHIGMKFVFVDDGGYGNFVLRLRTDE
jgi:GWxTD domain-containing protein